MNSWYASKTVVMGGEVKREGMLRGGSTFFSYRRSDKKKIDFPTPNGVSSLYSVVKEYSKLWDIEDTPRASFHFFGVELTGCMGPEADVEFVQADVEFDRGRT
jgi:hypothetical protein